MSSSLLDLNVSDTETETLEAAAEGEEHAAIHSKKSSSLLDRDVPDPETETLEADLDRLLAKIKQDSVPGALLVRSGMIG